MPMRLYDRLGAPAPFDPTDSFVTSPVLSPLALAAVRLLFAFYTLFTAVFVLVWQAVKLHIAKTYFSYFTELSYIGLCAYFWASGIQTLAYALHRGKRRYPLQRWPRFLQFLHVLLFSTITTFPFLVTIVFWAVLSGSSTFSTRFFAYSNISQHALNSVLALFELLFTHAGPTPWTHAIFIVILLGCYLGVAYITHDTQGFYTYSFLDPQTEHAKLVGWIIGIGAAGVIIFSVTRTVCVLRERTFSRGRGGRRSSIQKSRIGADTHAEIRSEALDEWEEVERPGSGGSGVGLAV